MYIVFEYMYALTCGASIGMHTCNVFPLFMKFDGPVKGVCVGGGGEFSPHWIFANAVGQLH